MNNPREFDEGVAKLIHYWWKTALEHDIWEAMSNAYDFRNLTYGLSQDIRVCAAERYLYGLYGSKPWGKHYSPGKELLYIVGKKIHLWIVPGFGSFPPSPYSVNAREWYNQGLSGFGGQLNIVPNVDCWRFREYMDGPYWNFAYGPEVGSGVINPNCQ